MYNNTYIKNGYAAMRKEHCQAMQYENLANLNDSLFVAVLWEAKKAIPEAVMETYVKYASDNIEAIIQQIKDERSRKVERYEQILKEEEARWYSNNAYHAHEKERDEKRNA